MAAFPALLVAAVVFITSAQKCIQPGWRNPDYVRPSPGAETIDYTSTCQPWSDMTCCTAQYTRDLAQGIGKIYNNFSYDYCGRMGDRCRQFLEWEECFYACDPYAAYFEDSGLNTGSFRSLPLCGNFCDDWFDACADELTCATDWVTDFAQDPVTFAWTGCKNNTCTRFRDRFRDGTDMCTRMWNTNFVVSRDPKKCFSPWFYSTNPNNFAAGIVPTTPAPNVITTELIAASVVAAVGWFCLFTFFCVQCARGDSRLGNAIRNKLSSVV